MIRIQVDSTRSVSALLQAPASPRACYVFAHGAGAGMTHPFMAAVADGLAERSIATLRYWISAGGAPAGRSSPAR